MVVLDENGNPNKWAQGIPQNNAGDLMMVTAWSGLGFIVRKDQDDPPAAPEFFQVERNENP